MKRYKINFKANDFKASKMKPLIDFFVKQYGECEVDDGLDIIRFVYEDKGVKYRMDVYTGEHRRWVEKTEEENSLSGWILLTDAELKFFDMLGYTLTDRFADRTKQTIEDWF